MKEFVHLRVASGFSFKYGASHPEELVYQASKYGMPILGLTDRDGLYGGVQFVKACQKYWIKPVIGVDFAVDSVTRLEVAEKSKTPAKGGMFRDESAPRVVVLASGSAGWGSLSKLISAAHQAGRRGQPKVTLPMLAKYASSGKLVVLLGSDSVVGKLVASREYQLAGRRLQKWVDVLGEQVVLAPSNRLIAGAGVGSALQAGRMVSLGDKFFVRTVLVNDVRMACASQERNLSILDSARLLTPISNLKISQNNREERLKPTAQMRLLADQVARIAGRDGLGGQKLLVDTIDLAQEICFTDGADIGLGKYHLPDFPGGPKKALTELSQKCQAKISEKYAAVKESKYRKIVERLENELATVSELGFAAYFLAVAKIVEMIKALGIRCGVRGSGAGSLINYLLGISGVDPVAMNLLAERFLSVERKELPDIDLDVESARRLDVYRQIIARFGQSQVACVGMFDTYRVRQAIRDVGAAFSLTPTEIDALAKSFPRVRAKHASQVVASLPELKHLRLADSQLKTMFELVESLDGLPRQLALHPCGIIIGGVDLAGLVPTEMSGQGFLTSQFDKDDVAELGLLKLDILGVRMQSSFTYTIKQIADTLDQKIELASLSPFNDESVYEMIQHGQTLGCFQIESPGQRELVARFGPENFLDIIIDISLFRPGPVKSDMVTPFLMAKGGWKKPEYLSENLRSILLETAGVVVFHEQIILILAKVTGCTLGQGDQVRRELGKKGRQAEIKTWFFACGKKNRYQEKELEKIWQVLVAFASFGFCKAHAAAFALPTYQSAWLKRYYPAAFLAGVLTYDPGMYPKRLLLHEARRMGIKILGLDVNLSPENFQTEIVGPIDVPKLSKNGLPDATGWGIRVGLNQVHGISEVEVSNIISARPYRSLTDFWLRSRTSKPTVEKLVTSGGFDEMYGEEISRRDLLLAICELENKQAASQPSMVQEELFSLSPKPDYIAQDVKPAGLPPVSLAEKVAGEMSCLGLDVSSHVMTSYQNFLHQIGVVTADQLFQLRNRQEVLVAGVKVATQTPPVKSGKRVIFLSIDDGTGVVDSTFFADTQEKYAAVIFNSGLLIVNGIIRRTGKRGVTLLGAKVWPLDKLYGKAISSPAGFAQVLKLIKGGVGEDEKKILSTWKKLVNTGEIAGGLVDC